MAIAAVLAALALGGLLKGAIGAGAPLVAVPVIAAFFDVRIAVAVMITPNIVTNLWQMRQFRSSRLPRHFALRFAFAGAVGVVLGTVVLAWASVATLSLLTAMVVISYIALRLTRPGFELGQPAAHKIVLPIGLAGGALQGATGISAPISVSFLNAMRLERPVFISTISVFFAVMSIAQLPALAAGGLMTWGTLALGVASLVPLFAFMPVGAWLARRVSAQTFDRMLLALLGVLSLKLLHGAFF